MTETLLTVTLPVNRGADQALAWPIKRPEDRLPYRLDAAAFLSQSGLTLLDVGVSATSGLVIHSCALIGAEFKTAVVVNVSGGAPNTTEFVALRLIFGGHDERWEVISLPIGQSLPDGIALVSPPAPEAALRVAGLVLTVAGSPVLV